MDIGGVREESSRWSPLEDRLEEGHFLGVRLENTIGQSRLLSSNEDWVDRIELDELLYFEARKSILVSWNVLNELFFLIPLRYHFRIEPIRVLLTLLL